MKILTSEQIYRADKATMENLKITSVDLMEQAAGKCVDWIQAKFPDKKTDFYVFCGIGNNGGDGLVIVRKLLQFGYQVRPFVVSFSPKRSEDFLINLKRLEDLGVVPEQIDSETGLPEIPENVVVIDAIFGIGLKRPPSGFLKELIQNINNSSATVIAIDFPSGLYSEAPVEDADAVVKATYTLTFQNPKIAFLLPQNEAFAGEWTLLDIGLDKNFIDRLETDKIYFDLEEARNIFKPRSRFSHKGSFGHSLIIAGGFGKMGAAVLAARGASRSGSGLVSAYVPKCGYSIMQTAIPEVMCEVDEEKFIRYFNFKTKPTAIGMGPGMGTLPETAEGFAGFLKRNTLPLILDADALNILAIHPELLDHVPSNSILTPHPGEFKRLVGTWKNDYEKIDKLIELSRRLKSVIVLKGANTLIAYADKLYVNASGNPALATGGSGDVLTGIITGLRAQNYAALHASLLGVFLHGAAADIAVSSGFSQESFIATDIEQFISDAFKQLY